MHLFKNTNGIGFYLQALEPTKDAFSVKNSSEQEYGENIPDCPHLMFYRTTVL